MTTINFVPKQYNVLWPLAYYTEMATRFKEPGRLKTCFVQQVEGIKLKFELSILVFEFYFGLILNIENEFRETIIGTKCAKSPRRPTSC